MAKKRLHDMKRWGWLIGLFCMGCAAGGTEGLPQYDPASGESYYTWLYRDSAFIECPGNPDRPWEEPVDMWKLAHIYDRMIRHATFNDTIAWDFTAEELKVEPRIFDFEIKMWMYDNIRLRSGKFSIELYDRYYRLDGDFFNFNPRNP